MEEEHKINYADIFEGKNLNILKIVAKRIRDALDFLKNNDTEENGTIP